MNRNLIYYGAIALILVVLIIPLPTYFTQDNRDNWRQAELITRDQPRIVIPAFNQIPLTYYSHKEEYGYTYLSEVPANFTQGYVIVGPAGGYDPPMWEWVTNLSIYQNTTGIQVYWFNQSQITECIACEQNYCNNFSVDLDKERCPVCYK
jgi:hypothetical protein